MARPVLFTITAAFLISLVELSIQECHPTPTPNKAQYIIGYDSLISSESKTLTYPDTGTNIPVNINGFKRTWTARGATKLSFGTTYLGADIDPKASLNGVIFSVPKEAIEKYDDRQRLYCRFNVPRDQVSIIRGNVPDNNAFPTDVELDNSEFWIYVTNPTFRKFPDERYPIVQSYVDIFLGGCISLERKYGLDQYARKCITTTEGWDNPWVNDRLHPRRPFTYLRDSWSIDQLIFENIPGYNTYLEKIYMGSPNNEVSPEKSKPSTALIVAIVLAIVCVLLIILLKRKN